MSSFGEVSGLVYSEIWSGRETDPQHGPLAARDLANVVVDSLDRSD